MDKITGLMHINKTSQNLSGDKFNEPEFHLFFLLLKMLNDIQEVGSHDFENGTMVLSVHSEVYKIIF